ncbi:MAG: SUMF1/EgtB/PvdO family nonheme iron enzyme [Kofleriaceae bacterium]
MKAFVVAGLVGCATVSVPAGTYVIGCADSTKCSEPRHEVKLAGFRIDRVSVTAEDLREWQIARGIPHIDQAYIHDELQVGDAYLDEALAYCADHGGSLPTAEQWEAAGRASDERIYTWGEEGGSGVGYRSTMFPNSDLGIAYAVLGPHQDRRAVSGVMDLQFGGFVLVDGIAHSRGGSDVTNYLPITLNRELGSETMMPFRCVYPD